MLTKTSSELTLFDTLSRLSFIKAAKLLGAEGSRLIAAGGKYEIDINTQVEFDRDRFRLTLGNSTVTLSLSPTARDRLKWRCDTCDVPCEHAGAAFSLILEEKLALRLADAPPERAPVESLNEQALVAQALTEREERARIEKMRLTSADPQEIWADYTLTNAASGKSYRVALRGWQPGESYCSCPDFRKNTLGTCKHILHALEKVRRRFPDSVRNRPYRQRDISLHLSYGQVLELRLLLPTRLDEAAIAIVRPIRDMPITDLPDLLKRIRRLEAQGLSVTVYPDAEEYIQTRLLQERIAATVAAIRRNPNGSVPQKKRQQLVHRFQRDPQCRVFLATNAGSTGLNLQAANTVINVDLPWNPAVLEQRIARAHRMGQRNPVQVYLLVTEGTIEEKLLGTLSAKHDLALAALDMESDEREVALSSGVEELKQRLEVLLGAKPHGAVDETERQRQQQETERLARRARVAEASGQLLSAAFTFLSEMIPQQSPTNGTSRMASEVKARLSESVWSVMSRGGLALLSRCRMRRRSRT